MTALIISLADHRRNSPRPGPFPVRMWKGKPCRVLHEGRCVAWIERINESGCVERRHVLQGELSGVGEDNSPCA